MLYNFVYVFHHRAPAQWAQIGKYWKKFNNFGKNQHLKVVEGSLEAELYCADDPKRKFQK